MQTPDIAKPDAPPKPVELSGRQRAILAFNQGVKFQSRGDHAKAIEYYQKAAEADADYAPT